MKFDVSEVAEKLNKAFHANSELDVLSLLKENSFLFYHLYDRKYGIQPNFCEVKFGDNLRCDFCWLNDNSDGPEWVLVEIEKPNMRLFTAKGEPGSDLNHAVEQVTSWDRYFSRYPAEMKRIFGAVGRFRYILVAGSRQNWMQEHAVAWRNHQNNNSKIEIRSFGAFFDAVDLYSKHPDGFWSFEENPKSLASKELKKYWSNYDYIAAWQARPI